MEKKVEVHAWIDEEVRGRIPELLRFYEAPSISRLIEGMLKVWITEMDKEKSLKNQLSK